MKLKDDWKQIIKKAWSVRLATIAALFSGAEVVLPMFGDVIPRSTFAVLSFVAVAGAVIARVLVQRDV